jgi:hypothetical protein
MRNIFLLSSSFSGSTLLSLLICSHPKVIGFGDTYNYQFVKLEETKCSCGAAPSITCPIRVKVQNFMKQSGFDFEWTSSNPTPLFKRFRFNKWFVSLSRRTFLLYVYKMFPVSVRKLIFSNYYKENIEFMNALKSCRDCLIYFDGSKFITRMELLLDIFPNTRVLHLIRSPEGFLKSCLKRGRTDYKKNINNWCRYNNNAHSYKKILGNDNYLLITYENLVKNTDSVLSKIQKFLGVNEIDIQDCYEENKKDLHIIGNKMKDSFKKVEFQKTFIGETLKNDHIAYINKKVSCYAWMADIFL